MVVHKPLIGDTYVPEDVRRRVPGGAACNRIYRPGKKRCRGLPREVTMADRMLDDIDALYSRAGIAPSVYREFTSRRDLTAGPALALDTPSQTQAATETTTSTAPQETASATGTSG